MINTKEIVENELRKQEVHIPLRFEVSEVARQCLSLINFSEIDESVNKALGQLDAERRDYNTLHYDRNVRRVLRIFLDRVSRERNLQPGDESMYRMLKHWQDVRKVKMYLGFHCRVYPCTGNNMRLLHA